MPGRVLTIGSGKGGVGKTTTAVNLAVALWTEGNAVAMVDADLGMANLAAVLGLAPETTLHDVLAGRADLDDAVVEAKDGDLLVLAGDRRLQGFADADPAGLETVLEALAERCDYVVVDTGAGLSYEDVLPLQLADEVLLVTTPDPAAVGDTRKTRELAGLVEGKVLGVVVTRADEDTDAAAVAADVGADLLGTVPEDPAVTASTAAGDPLASHAPGSPATAAYAELAAAIDGGADAQDADAAPGSAQEPAAESPESGDPSAERSTESAADAAGDGAVDEAHREDAEDEEPAEGEPDADATATGEDESDDDEPDEAPDQADGEPDPTEDAAEEATDEAAAPEESASRGGLTGWLGRLFS